jgi:hypothetical protein
VNDADLWFEHSLYTMECEVENVLGVQRQVSPSYRPAQRLSLEKVRDDLNKLIDEWGQK